MIQGFNQGVQRTVDIIRMQLTMEDMVSIALFYVIDAKTSYNILLDRPWLHENIVVPSTWHQYFKYYRNGLVKKVLSDSKSFTKAESHFADVKYYIEGAKKENRFCRPKSQSHVVWALLPLSLFVLPKRRVSSNYIVEGFSSTEDDKRKENPRESVFNRLGPHRRALHEIANKQSVFDRLGSHKRMEYQNKGVFKVITHSKKNTKSSPTQKIRSLISSRMRRQITLAISCGKVLKSNYISNGAEEDIAQTYHVTLIEEGEIEEEDAKDAPVELEEGVKATVDELKEVNLGNIEDPRPIYTSASLTQEEEGAYITLPHEFKDVFAWSYKKMPGLDPKVAVHHLSVKKGARHISSIVPVRKKNGQIRVCVDIRDLNNACPKNDFQLPIIELMIDATTGHETLSFMDGSSGYNQIRMAPTDEELMAFRTPKGIYCYKVMPFGLKNDGATYQKAMQRIFNDMLHKNVECYLHDLRKVFERLRRYHLKMDPSKCAFGVTSEKFLGFIVHQQGLEIEQAKFNAIFKMPEPRNIHELKSLQGKLAYLRRFISNLAGRCQPFSRLMKKDVPFEWDEACDKAFKSIKSYLMKPPVLVAPVHGRHLILYVVAQEHSVGMLLAQKNDEGKENALYYLSRTMTPNELKYSPIEKLCLVLIFAIQKLKHYFQSHSIHLVSKANPLKYVMTKPFLLDRLARWYLQLQQFEITYVPQKAVKGQVLADFLADHPMPAEWELSYDLPDEDVLVVEITPPRKMYFDGASHKERAGTGVVFVTSEGESKSMSCFHIITNAKRLMGWLGDVKLEHIPRRDNKQADALAKLASTLSMTDKEAHIPISTYDPRWRTDIRRRAIRFIYYKGTLYRRSFEGIFLCYLSDEEKIQAMEEAHSGVCGAHQSGPKLHFRIKRMGYYWPTMVKDCMNYAKRCQDCPFHANLIHQPPEPLHPTVASWRFDAWGLDVVGPMTKSSGCHLYILAATDYFSKWAKAVLLKEVKKENIADFIHTNIIYHYGVPSLLKKVVTKSKRDWHERIGEALSAYRTTVRTPTQSTPYALFYGVEAVFPLEHQITSLRIAIQGLTKEENSQIQL
ncbi:UNVERIFIED_CONTAM: Transposon Tf2-12 polyprotein [Sesamum latifolium]|uniref:Transposon Tf2-12 polyprotein n=1 Tax=Sesamum latifolium TaxID=2727402 RepID=A0AAW2WSN5_9LAMI